MDDEHDNFRNEIEKMPVYIKAKEITTICFKITEIIFKDYSETDNYSEKSIESILIFDYAKHIRENASIIPAKIAGAESGDFYDIRMENASIIRKCAREIYVNCTGLKTCNFKDVDYLELLRNEIDAFKPIFAEWVSSFDKWNYIIDRWGLFNPPGINYYDNEDDL